MADEIVVRVEEVAPTEIQVTVQEVGLVGPPGQKGQDSSDSSNQMDLHVHSTHPHPVYDDPDLVLLYENAKV